MVFKLFIIRVIRKKKKARGAFYQKGKEKENGNSTDKKLKAGTEGRKKNLRNDAADRAQSIHRLSGEESGT